VIHQGAKTRNLSGIDGQVASEDLIRALPFSSVTHYQFVHMTNVNRDFSEVAADVISEWKRMDAQFEIPYFPHVSVGWDNNPRFHEFRGGIMKDTTPENIRLALEKAKEYVDNHPEQFPLVTINSWNEWTETSYLLPDNVNGYGYLDAIKATFIEG
jgi:hypothetical protein